MRSDWILDVLADLRTFAQAIDMPALAEHLDDTALVAMAEIASRDERVQARTHADKCADGLHSGEPRGNELA